MTQIQGVEGFKDYVGNPSDSLAKKGLLTEHSCNLKPPSFMLIFIVDRNITKTIVTPNSKGAATDTKKIR
jgi:hypothetical protein